MKMKKIYILPISLVVFLVLVTVYAYSRFWNVAYVNGQGISRLSYLQTLDKQAGKQILEQMITETLILREGATKGAKIDQKVISEEIAKIEDKLKAQGQTLDAALAANGMTKSDLETQIRLKKTQDALSAPKVEITQAQIDEFLKINKAQLPAGKTKDELNTLAKNELTLEAAQASASAWLDNLRQSAKVIYK